MPYAYIEMSHLSQIKHHKIVKKSLKVKHSDMDTLLDVMYDFFLMMTEKQMLKT